MITLTEAMQRSEPLTIREFESIPQSEWNKFLDDLRDSGEMNMFGAVGYIERVFIMPRSIAKNIFYQWTETYNVCQYVRPENVYPEHSDMKGG